MDIYSNPCLHSALTNRWQAALHPVEEGIWTFRDWRMTWD